MTDPIADMLTRIRNGIQSRHDRVEMPSSKLKVEVAKILKSEGFISNYKVAQEDGKPPGHAPRVPQVLGERRAGHSRHRARLPSRAAACTAARKRSPRFSGGLGLAIVSTSKGVLSGAEAARDRRRRRSALPGLVRRSEPCRVSVRKRFRCRRAWRSARTATPSWSRDRRARC